MPTLPLGLSSHQTYTHTHTTHRIKMRVDMFSKIEIYESDSNNDRWWSNSTIYIDIEQNQISYIKMNTMSNQWRVKEEKQHGENKLISLAWMHNMIAASHNTPSLFSPPRNFRMISIELIWRAAAHSSVCTIRKEHTTKTDTYT